MKLSDKEVYALHGIFQAVPDCLKSGVVKKLEGRVMKHLSLRPKIGADKLKQNK